MVASKARFGENASRRLLRDVVSRDRPVCQPVTSLLRHGILSLFLDANPARYACVIFDGFDFESKIKLIFPFFCRCFASCRKARQTDLPVGRGESFDRKFEKLEEIEILWDYQGILSLLLPKNRVS